MKIASLVTRSLLLAALAVGSVNFLAMPQAAEATPSPQAGAVTGSITFQNVQRRTRAGQWVPAEGAIVTVYLQGSSFSRSGTVDRNGSLTMSGLPIGRYRATASWNRGERTGTTTFYFTARTNVRVDTSWRLR